MALNKSECSSVYRRQPQDDQRREQSHDDIAYDGGHRLSTRDEPGTVDDLSVAHDAAGRVHALTGGRATTTFNYSQQTDKKQCSVATVPGNEVKGLYVVADSRLSKASQGKSRHV